MKALKSRERSPFPIGYVYGNKANVYSEDMINHLETWNSDIGISGRKIKGNNI